MYLGIDIGGTKTLVATLDDNGVIQQRLRFPTAKQYDVFIRNLSDTVAYLSTNTFIAACIGAPGLMDRKKGIGIAFSNLPWKKVPLIKDVGRIVRTSNIAIENDSKLAALSEAMLLKGRYNRVMYITIGTGISAGVIVDQQIEPIFMDAEPGQMLLEHDGKLQKWESFASGKAIKKQFGKPASEITSKEDWRTIAHNLALGIIDLLAVVNAADVIVLGGGIGAHFEQFKEPLMDELRSYETPMVAVPPIIQAQRPEDAVLYGCYDLAKSLYGRSRS